MADASICGLGQLTDRFGRLLVISVALGVLTSALGAYLSYFLDGHWSHA